MPKNPIDTRRIKVLQMRLLCITKDAMIVLRAGQPARKKGQSKMENDYTTAAKEMIDDAVQDRDNGVITTAEFYRICAAAVEIFGRQPAKKIFEVGA